MVQLQEKGQREVVFFLFSSPRSDSGVSKVSKLLSRSFFISRPSDEAFVFILITYNF